LPIGDSRAQHILKVLKVPVGESFDVGQINGPKGKATLEGINDKSLELVFKWGRGTPRLYPIDLWVSYCRPQTCRRILQECTSLGVKSITFFDTEKCEPTYRDSRLWSSGEAQRLLIRGAEQAFCTRIPELNLGTSLSEAIDQCQENQTLVALDNYEATEDLSTCKILSRQATLAVGGERGWSATERHSLRDAGFIVADLGPRVLRTETACISAVSILRTHYQLSV
jgi:RsmE family RNA methyltransferase